jgi:hypothetical protein
MLRYGKLPVHTISIDTTDEDKGRTAIDNLVLVHLLARRRSPLLVDRVGLEPVVVRDEAKLGLVIRERVYCVLELGREGLLIEEDVRVTKFAVKFCFELRQTLHDAAEVTVACCGAKVAKIQRIDLK